MILAPNGGFQRVVFFFGGGADLNFLFVRAGVCPVVGREAWVARGGWHTGWVARGGSRTSLGRCVWRGSRTSLGMWVAFSNLPK